MFRTILCSLALCATAAVCAQTEVPLSTAGFYAVDQSATQVFNFNVGWRFHKGAVKDGESLTLADSSWPLVSVPHSLDVLPLESSGGVNSRCEAWYRKTFEWQPTAGERTLLHFEGIMGKSRIYVNGKLAAKQFGGYLPVEFDATEFLRPGKNLIAVMCDNRDDKSFPPGKPQAQLDFCYYGGLYRDVWLIRTPAIHQGDVHFTTNDNELTAEVEVINATNAPITQTVTLSFTPTNATSKSITVNAQTSARVKIDLQAATFITKWTPDSPVRYDVRVAVDKDVRQYKVGFREVAFSATEGLLLNGKPYGHKLFGVNRHQDFAHIGMALPNSLHVRDVIKLRQAGVRAIRNAHYPQDPAFMDACDALGLFVIVNTPGWQFWSDAPSFVNGVYSDIRRMVVRDRNRPCILLWEPILNETHYPGDFAAKAQRIVRDLDPTNGAVACDMSARGNESYDVIYRHPPETAINCSADGTTDENNRPSFTREFGDCVDNWNSHNSPSRVLREWGEVPQLIQAQHYVHAPYSYTDIETLQAQPAKHFGGTLWHAFDHGRGYHPDNFYGGIMDAARQPKFSYDAFRAALTRPAENPNEGYFITIANLMTPFSPSDVTVYSNCATIKLTALGKACGTQATRPTPQSLPEPVVFTNAFHFIDLKAIVRAKRWGDATIKAEGFDAAGKLVASAIQKPSYRRTKLSLTADDAGVAWRADGSDILAVVVRLTDDAGTVKRLDTETIRLEVSGAAKLIDGPNTGINPQVTRWGEAVFLLQSTTTPGEVTVKAELTRHGDQVTGSAQLKLTTQRPLQQLVYAEAPTAHTVVAAGPAVVPARPAAQDPKLLQEVERDQADFE